MPISAGVGLWSISPHHSVPQSVLLLTYRRMNRSLPLNSLPAERFNNNGRGTHENVIGTRAIFGTEFSHRADDDLSANGVIPCPAPPSKNSTQLNFLLRFPPCWMNLVICPSTNAVPICCSSRFATHSRTILPLSNYAMRRSACVPPIQFCHVRTIRGCLSLPRASRISR